MNMEAGGARCPFGPCRMYVGLELPTYLEPKGSNAFSEKEIRHVDRCQQLTTLDSSASVKYMSGKQARLYLAPCCVRGRRPQSHLKSMFPSGSYVVS